MKTPFLMKNLDIKKKPYWSEIIHFDVIAFVSKKLCINLQFRYFLEPYLYWIQTMMSDE